MEYFDTMEKIKQKRLECKLVVLENFESNFKDALHKGDSAMVLALAESLKAVIK
ncbi:TPA: hypothetical protein ACV42B_003030 [Listeria monocytogenes]|uniref:Lin2419 protein n=2 Tax=root TaxID=1 RepID=Q928W3_LISIN|nr:MULTISPECIES: hypothetical protein [Listeria]AGR03216.1 hypothetical protein M642_09730 [Listeria monocytogenes]EHJ4908573.1 hypothetical protein [Listeria monocytogenes]EHL2584487.1 hypothetical protein [Listeria monocytogenes]EHL2586732.1 hypothetical protein [Listeria monocytogenes]EHL2604318.1 hypothetical protein [Listeria monocytogenes]